MYSSLPVSVLWSFGTVAAGDQISAAVTILSVTLDTAIIAGDMAASLSLRGRGISPEDLLIASTAIAGQLTLVTANERHFQNIPGLKVHNWLK